MATTNDCKELIVDFIRKTPKIISSSFPGDQEAMELALDVKNWKRMYKMKAENSDYDPYDIYIPGSNRVLEVPCDDFVTERGFDCIPFKGQVAFAVVEDKEGKLYIANFIGD